MSRPLSIGRSTICRRADADAWLCSDYARLITGIDLVVDGGARAKNFAYVPAAPADLAGPLPLITLDSTQLPEG